MIDSRRAAFASPPKTAPNWTVTVWLLALSPERLPESDLVRAAQKLAPEGWIVRKCDYVEPKGTPVKDPARFNPRDWLVRVYLEREQSATPRTEFAISPRALQEYSALSGKPRTTELETALREVVATARFVREQHNGLALYRASKTLHGSQRWRLLVGNVDGVQTVVRVMPEHAAGDKTEKP